MEYIFEHLRLNVGIDPNECSNVWTFLPLLKQVPKVVLILNSWPFYQTNVQILVNKDDSTASMYRAVVSNLVMYSSAGAI